MPKKRIPAAFARVLDEHRSRLNRVVERSGVGRLKKLYDNANSELAAKLRRLAPGKADTFTAHQLRLFKAQTRQGQMVLARRMAGHLEEVSLEAQVEGLRSLADQVAALEYEFTGAEIPLPIEEAARFQGIIDGRRESLLRLNEASVARYTGTAIAGMEDDLAMSLMTGESIGETIERLEEGRDLSWYEAERIARTELTGAYNVTQYDGVVELAEDIPDMGMRWEEYVDDATGEPLDNRVDPDSIAMHGQVAKAGEMFWFPHTMPGGETLPKKLERFVGQSWPCPPMRPNDRASLSPWRPTWGIPGWRWDGSRRVPA